MYKIIPIAIIIIIPTITLTTQAENLAQPYPAPYHRAPSCDEHKIPGCITYGHLPYRRHYERDHFISLCLLGADIAARDPSRPPNATSNPGNVWYQPLGDARKKDTQEDKLCHQYRSGQISLFPARQQLRNKWSQ